MASPLGGTKVLIEKADRLTSVITRGNDEDDKAIVLNSKSAPFPDGDSILIAPEQKEEFDLEYRDGIFLARCLFSLFIYYDRDYECKYYDDYLDLRVLHAMQTRCDERQR